MSGGMDGAPGAAGSLAVEATRSSLWSLAGQIAQTLVGLATFAVLSRYLGPADYGLLGMAATVQGFLGVVGDSGMVAAVLRAKVVDAHVEATAFWVAIGGAAILASVSLAAAPLLGWFYREPSVTPLAMALAGTFLLAAPARVSTAKITRRLDFRTTTSINVTASVLALAGAWILARAGGGAWALVLQTALTYGFQTGLALVSSPVAIHPRLYSKAAAGELARFSSQMSGFSLSATAARAADQIVAGRLLGLEAVGVFSMGIKLLVVPIQRVCGAVSGVFLPTVLRLDEERHAEAFLTALRLTSLVTIPVTLGVYAIAPELVALLPARWSVLTTPLRLFALGSLVEPLGWYAVAGATARGRSRALLQAGLALVPVGWLAALVSALSGRVEWLVVAWGVVNAVGAALILAVVWQAFALHAGLLWRALALPHVLGAAMVVAVRATLWATGLRGQRLGALAGVAVGSAVYLLLLLAFERRDAQRLLMLVGRASGAIRLRS